MHISSTSMLWKFKVIDVDGSFFKEDFSCFMFLIFFLNVKLCFSECLSYSGKDNFLDLLVSYRRKELNFQQLNNIVFIHYSKRATSFFAPQENGEGTRNCLVYFWG